MTYDDAVKLAYAEAVARHPEFAKKLTTQSTMQLEFVLDAIRKDEPTIEQVVSEEFAEALVESKAGRDPLGEIAQLGAVVKRWYEWEQAKRNKASYKEGGTVFTGEMINEHMAETMKFTDMNEGKRKTLKISGLLDGKLRDEMAKRTVRETGGTA